LSRYCQCESEDFCTVNPHHGCYSAIYLMKHSYI
jgi:hypothetical protein